MMMTMTMTMTMMMMMMILNMLMMNVIPDDTCNNLYSFLSLVIIT